MLKLKAFIFGLCAILTTTDYAVAYVTPRVKALLREQREEYAKLEQCSKKVDGFKIAGISTLGLTAAGVAGNVMLSNEIKDREYMLTHQDKIKKGDKALDKLDYTKYTDVGDSCNTVFIYKPRDIEGDDSVGSLNDSKDSDLYFCMSKPRGDGTKQADSGLVSKIRSVCNLNSNVSFDYIYVSKDENCKCNSGFKNCSLKDEE